MRSTIFYMLRSLGVRNIDVSSLNDQVLGKIKSNDYDVILLGHNASDTITGIQLLEEARYRGYMKASSVWLFMTGDATQEVVLHAIDSHPDGLIAKPFSIDELKHRLDRLLQQKQSFFVVQNALDHQDYGRAIDLCRREFPPTHPCYDDSQLMIAELFLKSGRFSEAEKLASQLYQRTGMKEAGLIISKSLLSQGKLKSSIESLKFIIERSPLYLAAYDLLAEVYEQNGQSAEARDTLHLATSKSPLGIPRQMEVGRLAIQTSSLDMAATAYKRSIQLGRNSCYRSPEPYLRLANVRRLEVLSGSSDRKALLETEVTSLLDQMDLNFSGDPANKARSALMRSECFKALGDISRSQSWQEKAVEINNSLKTPLDLSREAESLTTKLIVPPRKSQPQSIVHEQRGKDLVMASKLTKMGVKRYLGGQSAQAIKFFSLALEHDAGSPAALINLAQLYLEWARDDKAHAKERLKMVDRYLKLLKAVKLSPSQEAHKKLIEDCRGMFPNGIPQHSIATLQR